MTLSRHALAAWLARRLEERTPAAIVRFGDGEESLLEARLESADSMRVATRNLEGPSGLRFSPDAVLAVRREIERAFDEADILGILFRHGLDPERVNKLTALYLEQIASGRRPAALAECQLHHAIVDRLPDLLAGRRVSVVSSRNVKPVLEGEWGLDDVVVYQVPSEYSARDLDGAYEAAMHDVAIWPDRHAELHSELTVRERGEVFLVGAGLWGKDLCIEVREKGGLALDLGSALDRIIGKVTRGPIRRVQSLLAKGVPPTEIAAQLRDRHGAEFDPEAIANLTERESVHSTGHPHTWRTCGFLLKPDVRLEMEHAQLDYELDETKRELHLLGRRPDEPRPALHSELKKATELLADERRRLADLASKPKA